MTRAMQDTRALIQQAYSAFNHRDIDAALALTFDPHIEPLAMTENAGGNIRVRAHQRVNSLDGVLLSDTEVLHVFTLSNGLI